MFFAFYPLIIKILIDNVQIIAINYKLTQDSFFENIVLSALLYPFCKMQFFLSKNRKKLGGVRKKDTPLQPCLD